MAVQKTNLTGIQKASLLLLSLGEDVSSEVLTHFNKYEIQKIANALANVGGQTEESLQHVLEEFCRDVGKHVGLPSDGGDYVKSVLTKAMGQDRAEAVLRETTGAGVDTREALKSLSMVDSETLGKFLETEHPQVMALIVAHLEHDRAGEVLNVFPEDLQQDVIWRIANLETIDSNILKEIDEAFEEKFLFSFAMRTQKVGGVQSVADILSNLGKSSEQSILGYVGKKSPELAEEIRELMFTFEDLDMLDDQGIQMILREVGRNVLALALRAASNAVKNKFLGNMSSEASEMLQEDMEALGPVRRRAAEQAQKEILGAVHTLEEEGRLVLGGRGGGKDDILV